MWVHMAVLGYIVKSQLFEPKRDLNIDYILKRHTF